MRKSTFTSGEAILYLVATPIGNLEDMTFRAVRILSMVENIYAEDTRNSKVLLNHYDIKTPLLSYHEFNKELKSEEILSKLKDGKSIAIISDAGLPVISDPGFHIALLAIENDIPVSTIPGASAGISALVASGLPPMPYTFYGFLDSKTTKRCQELEKLKYMTHTIIFYEAPHRISQTLEDMLTVLGNRKVVLARELTKKFEEYVRGSIEDVLKVCNDLKGEMVLIVEGYISKDEEQIEPNQKIEELISLGFTSKEAIKEVSSLYHLDKKELYKSYVDYKQNK